MWHEPSGICRLMLLNTDWTTAGNSRKVKVTVPWGSFETEAVERQPGIITVLEDGAVETADALHVEVTAPGKLRLHGSGETVVTLHYKEGRTEKKTVAFDKNSYTEISF